MTVKQAKKLKVALGAAKVSPGMILKEEFLIPLNMSVREAARQLNVTPTRISEIVRGKRAITAETALRLATVFSTTPYFWLNLQMQHDLAKAALVTELV